MGGGESSKGRLLSVPLHPRAVTVDAVLLYILLPLSLSHSPSSSFTTTHSDLFLPNVHCFCGGAKWGTPLRPPSSAGWNEPPPHSFSSASLFFTFPPTLCVCFPLSLSSRVLYIPNEDVRWWALPPSWPFWSFAAHSLNSPTTNNGRKLLMPSHFFFPHSSHPSVYRYPHKNCRSCFSYLPFFFSLYFNTVTTKFFFSSKTNKTTKKKGRFENRKSANNLTACEERKNNISEVLTSAKSFTVGESKKQTTDGFPAGSWLFVDFHTLDDNIFLFLFLFFFLDMNKKRGRKKKEGLAGG